MRITFLTPAADMSGGARVIHVYASLLQQRGHDVSVVTRPAARARLKDRLRGAVLGKVPAGIPQEPTHYDDANYNLITIDRARAIEARDLPDAEVVVATWWETAEWMMALPSRKGRKVHFVQHYEAFENMPKDRVDAILSLQIHRITISAWLDDLLRNTFGQQSVSVVRNSVDMAQFNAPPRGRRDRPTVGMLYSDITWKDFSTGLAAFYLLREKLSNAQLVTFGNKPVQKQHVLPQNSEHTVLPAQDEIRAIYASCDVWLCSSTAEGFHLPPLEAMACRCPVISTPVGGPADIIREGVNGHLVPISNASAMAQRLDWFFAQPEDCWREMSNSAHDTAARYSWKDATDLFEIALLAE